MTPQQISSKKGTPHETLLTEVGWEVCLQLGGIYTVLRTKAQAMVDQWGDRYCLIGPYKAESAAIEFEPEPRTGPFGEACDLLEKETGIKTHFGRWQIEGRPRVVLVDYQQHWDWLGRTKHFMWSDHQIPLKDDPEVDACVLFGYLVTEYLGVLTRIVDAKRGKPLEGVGKVNLPLLAHFHEWMAAVPIPPINKRGLPIQTVFTTHATILGRFLAADDPNFYDNLPHVDPHKEAGNRQIYAKFAIERAAANGATCFTTVSEITAMEAEKLLGRKADVLVPNGLNSKRTAAVHEFQNLHLVYKKKIQQFLMAHFFPSSRFDLDRTQHIFTSGRYEPRNKGFDLFIESLARLNHRLKKERSDVTVVAFFITKTPTRAMNVHVLKNLMLFREMSGYCQTVGDKLGERILSAVAGGQDPRGLELLESRELLNLKRLTHAWKQTHPLPNMITHDLVDEGKDALLNQLRAAGLVNKPEDPVKIVYHPDFLTAASPILGLDYEQFVRGCHLGVFPSYYEAWGYTPEECAAVGIPSITSDLAGFGAFVKKNVENHDDKGLFIVERRYKSYHESADQLTSTLFKVMNMNMRERIEMRNRVEVESTRFEWKQLIPTYEEAHRIAMARVRGRKAA